MDRQVILAAAAVFIISVSAGGYLAFQSQEKGVTKPVEPTTPLSLNYTANDDEDVVTASFYGKKVNLMHEDSEEASFYLDIDRDGGSDIEFDSLTHDGRIHNFTEIVTKGKTDYRLYFRYRDNSTVTSDAWLTLFRAEKL